MNPASISAVQEKKELLKEYVLKLNEMIQLGAVYGDEGIESLRIESQNRLDILQELIDEEKRESAIDNMEFLDEDEDLTSNTLFEITQDILDSNGVGSFSKF